MTSSACEIGIRLLRSHCSRISSVRIRIRDRHPLLELAAHILDALLVSQGAGPPDGHAAKVNVEVLICRFGLEPCPLKERENELLQIYLKWSSKLKIVIFMKKIKDRVMDDRFKGIVPSGRRTLKAP